MVLRYAQVGNAFVQQYYLVLHQSPDLVYRFYQDASRLARPARDAGSADGMESVTTMEVSGAPGGPRSGHLFRHFVLVPTLSGFLGVFVCLPLRRRR